MSSYDYKLLDDDADKAPCNKPKREVETFALSPDPSYVFLGQSNTCNVEKKELEARCLRFAKINSMLIGLVMGCFIQCATLGMDMVILVKSTMPLYFTFPVVHIPQQTIYFIYAWAFFTSALGASMLIFLRALLEACLLATTSVEIGKSWEEERFIFKFLLNVDTFFSIGAIVGVSCCWYVHGLYLGMGDLGYEGFHVIALCLLWYGVATAIMNESIDTRKKHLAEKKAKKIAAKNATLMLV